MPAIRIDAHSLEEGETLPAGVSRFGGFPDLPLTIEWPVWNDVPLTFLAQFNMADVTEYDIEGVLPSSGMLYVFYEADEQPSGFFPSERGAWRVLYFDGDLDEIQQVSPPSELKISFAPANLEFSSDETLPTDRGGQLGDIELSDEDAERYLRLKTTIAASPSHQFLGHPEGPDTVLEMPFQCQLASNGVYPYNNDPREAELRDGASDWRLLLQIDTDTEIAPPEISLEDGFVNIDVNAAWIWHDAGMLYFWIQKDALQQRNFDNVWMQLEGG